MNSRMLRVAEKTLFIFTFPVIVYALYLVFLVVPNERMMGPVQRIFYFHVGSAFACYCAVAVVLCGGVWYLATRSKMADIVAEAAGEVGFVLASVVLASGMIWGHSAWNAWFVWEPRLVSFLLLWLIFLAFNLLRVFGDPSRVAQHSAVLGIVGAITVPIVVFSIQLLPQVAQLHPPDIIANRGLRDSRFVEALIASSIGMVLLQGFFICFRTRYGILREGVRELRVSHG